MVTGEMFEPVLASFAIRHRVILPDLVRLLDHLGIEKTDILGYSQGGAIAQQLVLDHPQLCRRLVLACTYVYDLASRRERFRRPQPLCPDLDAHRRVHTGGRGIPL